MMAFDCEPRPSCASHLQQGAEADDEEYRESHEPALSERAGAGPRIEAAGDVNL